MKYEKVKEFLSYLISLRVDLNARDKWNFTALNYAAIKNNFILAKLLIENNLHTLNQDDQRDEDDDFEIDQVRFFLFNKLKDKLFL